MSHRYSADYTFEGFGGVEMEIGILVGFEVSKYLPATRFDPAEMPDVSIGHVTVYLGKTIWRDCPEALIQAMMPDTDTLLKSAREDEE